MCLVNGSRVRRDFAALGAVQCPATTSSSKHFAKRSQPRSIRDNMKGSTHVRKSYFLYWQLVIASSTTVGIVTTGWDARACSNASYEARRQTAAGCPRCFAGGGARTYSCRPLSICKIFSLPCPQTREQHDCRVLSIPHTCAMMLALCGIAPAQARAVDMLLLSALGDARIECGMHVCPFFLALRVSVASCHRHRFLHQSPYPFPARTVA